MSGFVYIDSPAPQRVRISWDCVREYDESADRPDQMQDGFWPSLDPLAAGFIGDDPTDVDGTKQASRFLEQQKAAEFRMAAFDAGDWNYMGVRARAIIHIPLGGQSFRVLRIESAGLWGIESDCGDDYVSSIFDEQRDSLLAELKTLGAAFGPTPGDYDEEGPEL